MMGGYRVVRRLGAGERAEVFLGHPVSDAASAAGAATIKVYRSGVAPSSLDDEIAVLATTRSPHLLHLIDVATAPDGRPCLILPRLSGGSLARLLADRGVLGVGEAVTILAPLCDAVGELHAARCWHGAIRPGAVLFDDRGAPVLACFGSASRFVEATAVTHHERATPAELAAEPGVAADLQRLGALAGVVLSRAVAEGQSARHGELLAWLREVEPALEPHGFAAELRDRLFALAPAAPVDFAGAGLLAPHAIDTRPRTPRAGGTPVEASPLPATDAVGTIPGRLRPKGAVAIARARFSALAPRSVAVFHRARTALAATRRSFRILAAAALLAVVLAMILVPTTARSDPAARHDPRTTASASTRPVAAEPSVAPRPAAGVTDDPLEALDQLLRVRDRCIARLSVACLEAVDQPDSSALDDDSYLIRSLQQGAVTANSQPLAGGEATLAQRLGDSALLTLQTTKAGLSILLVKQQSGWRIRDFLPE
jgi:hypothetical protein